ncbi:MAG: hypothetical protein AAFQ18_08975 [Pseudomonadota bacterium]
MPFQNRVDPFSRVHAVSMRGMFTGNRGILHDPTTRTLKSQRWTTNGWVICTLDWKGHQAPIMGTGHWTELFFLDEAVALAAGHRPCHACRKERAITFRDAAGYHRIGPMSDIISSEMKPFLRARRPEPRPSCRPRDLPDGAFLATGDGAFLKWCGAAYPFAWQGYGAPVALPDHALRLTPTTTCKALAAGYRPTMHPSLGR